jgi:alpha-D-xyloside xylohydrolase
MLRMTAYPDGEVAVPVMDGDCFQESQSESLPLALVERDGKADRTLFSLHALPGESFGGTGERFRRMDLAGQTFTLENDDARGVNNRRAYKNVPFYVTDRPYGLFINTSHHVRLSLADISTRAAQGLIEEPVTDLFLVGGGNVRDILHYYRCLTGFPEQPPLWSYGTWMSRMTYYAEDEVKEVGRKLREQLFPCDVLHLDTGWFDKDWLCDWKFSEERFGDPATFMQEMKEMGYRISLWQKPTLNRENPLLDEARENRYLAPIKKEDDSEKRSEFSEMKFAGHIDFTNPDAVTWYKDLLRDLFEKGAVVIKADFGERIAMNADYHSTSPEALHNLYALLYQKAAYEVTKEVTGGNIIWARAGWAGCQRYPIHWGGDASSTWDGLAGTLRGGLHLGLSGFGFWSHDVGGFHGVPDFMCSWPSAELYLRWAQFGVFSSHFRFHGTTPREPYEYPEVADHVRKWLNLRYALIPYMLQQAEVVCRTGMPMLRPLMLDHEDDPICWQIDDQYLFGAHLLVAPFVQPGGRRDVYLPEGTWVDFWSGELLEGGRFLKNVTMGLERMPIYARYGSRVPVYPHRVQCTDEMDLSKAVDIIFDESWQGIEGSLLAEVTGLEE